MEISVIIPVFNAEPFIRKAAESAVCQAEVTEIILVEDNSEDESLRICKKLEKEYEKIHLLRHQDEKNHGAGATRNLGIKNSGNNLIAFLDADDFYLPNRFTVACELFKKSKDIDGVYEAIGTYYYKSNVEKIQILKMNQLTTLKKKIEPGELFYALARGNLGSLSLDGLTVKKNIFEKYGYFDESLKLHQDSNWMIQMSSYAKLVPGRLSYPVAMRGIHGKNRSIYNKNIINTKTLARRALFNWGYNEKLCGEKMKLLFYNYFLYLYLSTKINKNFPCIKSRELKILLNEICKHPILSVSAVFQYISRKQFFNRN